MRVPSYVVGGSGIRANTAMAGVPAHNVAGCCASWVCNTNNFVSNRLALTSRKPEGNLAKSSNCLDHCYGTGNAFASDVESAAVRH